MGVFGDEREGERLARELHLIGLRGKFDRTTIRTFELPQIGGADMCEGEADRSDVSAGYFAGRFDNHSLPEFRVLLGPMPWYPDNTKFRDHAFRLCRHFQAHGFIHDAAITPKERPSFTEGAGGGDDVKKQPGLAGVRLLRKVEPEGAIADGLRGEFEEFRLTRGRYPTAGTVKGKFR